MVRSAWLGTLLLTGCVFGKDGLLDDLDPLEVFDAPDDDGDGYDADRDCDDADPSVNPGAIELCDDADFDEDCDGESDDADHVVDPNTYRTLYEDADGDGHGDSARAVQACDPSAGIVEQGGDCDDADPAVHPDADERCNSVDDDCDGLTDTDSSVDAPTWHRDADDDGYGDPDDIRVQCDAPSGYVRDDGQDCDDRDDAVRPGATETCNGVDDDCDGSVDPDTSSDAPTWYADTDRDGYGDPGTSRRACDAPAGHVAAGGDCDDDDDDVSPGHDEVCDDADVDEDCDGLSDDDDASLAEGSRSTWYRDADRDGYGTLAVTGAACDTPTGYTSVVGDCDDTDAAINPLGAEVCDAADADEDCDGNVDDDDSSVSAASMSTFYVDADWDGYGSMDTALRCDAGRGYASNRTDCDDAWGLAYPGGTEVCDDADRDEDCDGLVDDADASVAGRTTWYRDGDGDGYGAGTVTAVSCDEPTGYVGSDEDCDDGADDVSPGATEVCGDATDQDCDGSYACIYEEVDAGSAIIGAAYDGLGRSLAWAGDPDGDGVGSLWIGADRNADGSGSLNSGAVYLVDAGSDGDVDTARTVQYTNSESNGRAGFAVAAGDWDRDGVEDVVVGTPGVGRVWWAFGGGSGVERLADQWGYTAQTASTQFGYALAVGDYDGDDYDDVLVGAPYVSSYLGGAWLYSNLDNPYGVDIRGDTTTYTSESATSLVFTGWSVALGDLDGDGTDDAIVGAPARMYGSYSYAGMIYVDYAPGSGTVALSGADARLHGTDVAYAFGSSVVADGDVDGDGRTDLLVTSAVSAHLFLTPPTGALNGTTTSDFAISLATAPSAASLADLDGDALGDVTLGASTEDSVWFFTGADGFAGEVGIDEADVQIEGAAGSYLGGSLLVVPDWDGDGGSDLVVGAPMGGAMDGYVLVYSGTLFGGP